MAMEPFLKERFDLDGVVGSSCESADAISRNLTSHPPVRVTPPTLARPPTPA
jgi:hypothetical protein